MLQFIGFIIVGFVLYKIGKKLFFGTNVAPTETLEEKRTRLKKLKEQAANLEEEVKVTTDIKGVSEKVRANQEELNALETEIESQTNTKE